MLDKLKDHYRQALKGKIETIKAHLREMRAGDKNAEDKIRILAHSFHGSGTTYGFPDISAAAKNVEHADDKSFLKNLTVLITVLQDVATEVQDEVEEAPKPLQQEKKILIIEDDADISSLLRMVLGEKLQDYAIEVCETGHEAHAVLKTTWFSLIILDLVLPDCDGRQLLRIIKDRTQKDVPVFILSGTDNEKIQADCMQLGASHFFKKPFDADKIADEMVAVFNGKPIYTPPPPVMDNIKPVSPRPRSGKVLLAEDDELLARIILHRLSREGLTIDHRENGEEALKALAETDYDLVILDVKMPIIDGFEVLARFREDTSNSDVPVIILSAMGSEKDIVRGYDLGATDYIQKPFSPVELIARVKSLLKEAT